MTEKKNHRTETLRKLLCCTKTSFAWSSVNIKVQVHTVWVFFKILAEFQSRDRAAGRRHASWKSWSFSLGRCCRGSRLAGCSQATRDSNVHSSEKINLESRASCSDRVSTVVMARLQLEDTHIFLLSTFNLFYEQYFGKCNAPPLNSWTFIAEVATLTTTHPFPLFCDWLEYTATRTRSLPIPLFLCL